MLSSENRRMTTHVDRKLTEEILSELAGSLPKQLDFLCRGVTNITFIRDDPPAGSGAAVADDSLIATQRGVS